VYARRRTRAQPVQLDQHGELIQIEATARGRPVEEGGDLWRGELRLWDNEILMGWYAASDGSVRSKGTMYFVMHPHGISAAGRWVGLSYDFAPIRTIDRWHGQVHDTTEGRVALRTRGSLLPQIIERTNQDHPTRCPASSPSRSSTADPTTSAGSWNRPQSLPEPSCEQLSLPPRPGWRDLAGRAGMPDPQPQAPTNQPGT
jgi:hypothetical protein